MTPICFPKYRLRCGRRSLLLFKRRAEFSFVCEEGKVQDALLLWIVVVAFVHGSKGGIIAGIGAVFILVCFDIVFLIIWATACIPFFFQAFLVFLLLGLFPAPLLLIVDCASIGHSLRLPPPMVVRPREKKKKANVSTQSTFPARRKVVSRKKKRNKRGLIFAPTLICHGRGRDPFNNTTHCLRHIHLFSPSLRKIIFQSRF